MAIDFLAKWLEHHPLPELLCIALDILEFYDNAHATTAQENTRHTRAPWEQTTSNLLHTPVCTGMIVVTHEHAKQIRATLEQMVLNDMSAWKSTEAWKSLAIQYASQPRARHLAACTFVVICSRFSAGILVV